MKKRGRLTQVAYDEQWEVSVGKEKFTLTRGQIELLKKATSEGYRGIVWFDSFAISIPHVMYIKRRSRNYWRVDGGCKTKISRGEYERLSGNKIKQLAEGGKNASSTD